MLTAPPVSLATEVKDLARRLGFDLAGATSADPTRWADYYREWIGAGRHGKMAWLARDADRRTDPRRVLPGARSLLVVGLNYWQPHPQSRGRIARYALGDDYHELMSAKLEALLAAMTERFGPEHRHKLYVDTGPVLERPLAQRAGVGWQAKSTMVLSQQFGPWLFLGEIITTLPLEPDAPATDRCGKCTACLDACPTGAITGPYQLDARRCISYLTIELKGSIPEELRPLIGDRIYGCDECLEVCPWNRFAQTSRETRFLDSRLEPWDLHELLTLSPQDFNRRFKRSPIKRTKRRGLLRNVCVALGNIGNKDDLPILEHTAAFHDEPLVREHADWGARQIRRRLGLGDAACQTASGTGGSGP
ncbi:MAG: tRNA epoxyqueuosine(34) reductase QueG [Verrucomicrobiota bacterium]